MWLRSSFLSVQMFSSYISLVEKATCSAECLFFQLALKLLLMERLCNMFRFKLSSTAAMFSLCESSLLQFYVTINTATPLGAAFQMVESVICLVYLGGLREDGICFLPHTQHFD